MTRLRRYNEDEELFCRTMHGVMSASAGEFKLSCVALR